MNRLNAYQPWRDRDEDDGAQRLQASALDPLVARRAMIAADHGAMVKVVCKINGRIYAMLGRMRKGLAAARRSRMDLSPQLKNGGRIYDVLHAAPFDRLLSLRRDFLFSCSTVYADADELLLSRLDRDDICRRAMAPLEPGLHASLDLLAKGLATLRAEEPALGRELAEGAEVYEQLYSTPTLDILGLIDDLDRITMGSLGRAVSVRASRP